MLDKNKVEVNIHTGVVNAIWIFSEDTPALFKDIFIKRIKQGLLLKRKAHAHVYADGNGLIITYPSMDIMKKNIGLTSHIIKSKLVMCHDLYMNALKYQDIMHEIGHRVDIMTEGEKQDQEQKSSLLEEKGDWPE
jgi:hypothetical protein